MKKRYILVCRLCCVAAANGLHAQSHTTPRLADKPLYRDPVYDGAADPVTIGGL